MTQPLRNPQLRHAAAGSRRNGFRHSGVPDTQGPSIPEQNRNPPDPASACIKGGQRPEESQSESSSQPVCSSRLRVYPTPDSHQPSHISQHSLSLFVSLSLPLLLVFPSSSVPSYCVLQIQSSLPASPRTSRLSIIRWPV